MRQPGAWSSASCRAEAPGEWLEVLGVQGVHIPHQRPRKAPPLHRAVLHRDTRETRSPRPQRKFIGAVSLLLKRCHGAGRTVLAATDIRRDEVALLEPGLPEPGAVVEVGSPRSRRTRWWYRLGLVIRRRRHLEVGNARAVLADREVLRDGHPGPVEARRAWRGPRAEGRPACRGRQVVGVGKPE